MRKFLSITILIGCLVSTVHAQWTGGTTDSNPIYRSGKVGIGITTLPQTKLDVDGLRLDSYSGFPVTEGTISESKFPNYIIGDAVSQRLKLGVVNDGYTRAEIFIDNSNRIDGTIEFKTTTVNAGAQTRMFINGAGNVGIGTTTPQSKLDIDGLRLDSFNGFPAEGSVLEGKFPNYIIGDAIHQKLRLGVVNDGYTRAEILLDNDNRVDGTIVFKTTNTNSISQPRMTIDGAGNVGIGAAAPQARLDVDGLRLDSFQGFPKEEGSISEAKFPNYIIGDAGSQKLKLGVSNDGYTRAEIFLDNSNRIDGTIRFKTTNAGGGAKTQMSIDGAGNVGIGIGDLTADAKLAVNGQVHATEVRVSATVPGPDYVFENNYSLPTLESVKTYIDQNKHLPEVPSAKEMEANGINLSEMNMLLLKKVEELTLYVIEQNSKIEKQQTEINELKRGRK